MGTTKLVELAARKGCSTNAGMRPQWLVRCTGRETAMISPRNGSADVRPATGPLRLSRDWYHDDLTGLCKRLSQVRGNRSLRKIAKLTGSSPESTRRYLAGQRPSAEFLMAVCSSMDVSALWLLRGEGPTRQSDVAKYILSTVNEVELCGELGRRIMAVKENAHRDNLRLDEKGLNTTFLTNP